MDTGGASNQFIGGMFIAIGIFEIFVMRRFIIKRITASKTKKQSKIIDYAFLAGGLLSIILGVLFLTGVLPPSDTSQFSFPVE